MNYKVNVDGYHPGRDDHCVLGDINGKWSFHVFASLRKYRRANKTKVNGEVLLPHLGPLINEKIFPSYNIPNAVPGGVITMAVMYLFIKYVERGGGVITDAQIKQTINGAKLRSIIQG